MLQARIADAGVPEDYVGFTPNCRPSPVPTERTLRVDDGLIGRTMIEKV